MEMFVVQEKRENRNRSVFYRGQIAYAVMPNGRRLALQACGPVKFVISGSAGPEVVYGHAAVNGGLEKMASAGLTDRDLPQDPAGWCQSNHFEIVKLSPRGDVVGDGIPAGEEYDAAMDQFLNYCVTIIGG